MDMVSSEAPSGNLMRLVKGNTPKKIPGRVLQQRPDIHT